MIFVFGSEELPVMVMLIEKGAMSLLQFDKLYVVVDMFSENIFLKKL